MNQLIIDKLNSKFKNIILSANFLHKENWNQLILSLEKLRQDVNLEFVVKPNQFYEVLKESNLSNLLNLFDLYHQININNKFIAKNQLYSFADEISSKKQSIISEVRKIQFNEIIFDFNVFEIENDKLIRIKQFENKEFNLFFLRLLGFNF